MNQTSKILLLVAGCLVLTGCDTYTAADYSVSIDNNIALKRMAPANVTVGSFTGPDNPSMLCRLVGPLHLPGDIAPQDYISQALAAELQFAGLSGNPGKVVTLTGSLDAFSFNSMMGDASWDLAITVVSSNGTKLSIADHYPFSASFVGDAACHNVVDAFEPAVQDLTTKLIANPGFPALLKD